MPAGGQASIGGQSSLTVQPQAPLRQTCPALDRRQFTQTPDVPHAVLDVPATHIPFEQHPPLHGAFELQEVLQV